MSVPMATVRIIDTKWPDGDARDCGESMATIMGRVSEELKHIAGEVGQLQLLLSDILLEASLKPEVLRDLQSVDHIEQKLEALSQFLRALMPQMDDSWRLDVTRAAAIITLLDLSHRLQNKEGRAPEEDTSGDLDLF
jgi:hypothetical protein